MSASVCVARNASPRSRKAAAPQGSVERGNREKRRFVHNSLLRCDPSPSSYTLLGRARQGPVLRARVGVGVGVGVG
eukprot:7380784-Prymnesium_polylepis.1